MSSIMLDWFLNTLTPTDQHVPSTAEIIQKCLNVNPFDLKFREANMQVNQNYDLSESQRFGNSGFSGSLAQNVVQQATSIALPSMLKLPSFSSQSPGIFSNINVLSADFEDELRKTIDFSRKLRETCDDSKKEPRTADVIDGVIDVEFNRSNTSRFYHQLGATDSVTPNATNSLTVSSSTSFLNENMVAAAAQDLIQAAAAYSSQLTVSMNNNNCGFPTATSNSLSFSSSLIMCPPSTSSDVLSISLTESSFAPSSVAAAAAAVTTAALVNLSTQQCSPTLNAATTAAFLQQKSSMVSKIMSSEKLMSLQSSSNTALNTTSVSSPVTYSLSVPIISSLTSVGNNNLIINNQSSPNVAIICDSVISPSDTSNLIELKKTSSTIDLLGTGLLSTESHQSVSSAPSIVSDSWDSSLDVKPILNFGKRQQSDNILHLQHPVSSQTFCQNDDHSSAFSSETSVNDMQDSPAENFQRHEKSSKLQKRDKARKYMRYNHGSGGNDSQVTSTRGGRGRRSITTDMQPEERRNTILERNKAAAVRYRKRKKEEHDDMITRVQELEQDNNSLQTRNVVLVHEIERLNALIKAHDSNCVCRTNNSSLLAIAIDNTDSHLPINFSGDFSVQKQQ